MIIDATLIKKQANSYRLTPSSGQALTYEESSGHYGRLGRRPKKLRGKVYLM